MWLTGFGIRVAPFLAYNLAVENRRGRLGWAEGFEPSATGTTIRRSTKLSYAHRNLFSLSAPPSGKQCAPHPHSYNPAFFHKSSTRCFTSADISITPGQGRVNPSPGHFLVASIPIFEP